MLQLQAGVPSCPCTFYLNGAETCVQARDAVLGSENAHTQNSQQKQLAKMLERSPAWQNCHKNDVASDQVSVSWQTKSALGAERRPSRFTKPLRHRLRVRDSTHGKARISRMRQCQRCLHPYVRVRAVLITRTQLKYIILIMILPSTHQNGIAPRGARQTIPV